DLSFDRGPPARLEHDRMAGRDWTVLGLPHQTMDRNPSTRRHGVVVGHLALQVSVLGQAQTPDGPVVSTLLRRARLEPGRLRALDRLGVHPLGLRQALVPPPPLRKPCAAVLVPALGPPAPGA